jgi:acetolactate decarboxylase
MKCRLAVFPALVSMIALTPLAGIGQQQSSMTVPDLFQVSTLNALDVGIFEGAYPVGMLREQGNFGVGTYDGIDGEMVVLDGHFYHVRSDGSIEESANSELASFAAVVNFVPEKRYTVSNMSMSDLDKYIASIIPSDNYFYAIRIHGKFASVTTRAIPKLFMPYPTLAVAVQKESIFGRQDVEGTAVVIRSPAYVSNLNEAGDHYHFISEDKRFGGHVLSLTADNVTLEVQKVRQNSIWLPANEAFGKANLPDPSKQ